MRKTLRAPITFNDREILLTASIGLALADNQPQRKEDVLKDAELAMYYAKRIGGDRIEVFKPAMRARKSDRLTMETTCAAPWSAARSRSCISRSCGWTTAPVAGFEALMRWDHPKMGRMPPSDFIAIAEDIGLIVDLGLFALEQTARQLAAWQRARALARAGLRQRQRLVAPAAAPRPDPGLAHGAVAHRARARARSSWS